MSEAIDKLSQDMRSLREDFHRMLGTRLTREQFAERLNISTRTLYNRIESGSVPRPGPDGRWLLSDVMEWERR
jgi:predicted DNA-binding transcriptional regulator AlpA